MNYWNRGCNMQIESMKALTRLRQPSIGPLVAEVAVEPARAGRVRVRMRAQVWVRVRELLHASKWTCAAE